MVTRAELRPTCPENSAEVFSSLVQWCSKFDPDERPSFEWICEYFQSKQEVR
jgi:hypothetical protein